LTLLQGCFAYLALAMIGLSILTVTMKNPVHSVIAMLALFVHIAALYLFLNAELIAAIQIIVYAGAVLVLYLFVVMLFNIKEEAHKKIYHDQWPLAFVGSVFFLVYFVLIAKNIAVLPKLGPHTVEAIQKKGSLLYIGKELFTTYVLPFEIVSLLLLIAIIGAVVLTKKGA
jgi:NADH-quinone oxidoreductase subunit J